MAVISRGEVSSPATTGVDARGDDATNGEGADPLREFKPNPGVTVLLGIAGVGTVSDVDGLGLLAATATGAG
jgi:hypothetical protein